MRAKMLAYFLSKGLVTLGAGYVPVASVPIIYVSEEGEGEEFIVVYWYDVAKDHQYEFRLCVSPDDIDKQYAADPKNFHVVFLGQLKDLPNDHEFFSEAVEYFNGDEEKWILLAFVSCGSRVIFMSEVVVSAEGVINPDTYMKVDERDLAMKRLNNQDRTITVGYSSTAMMDRSRGIPDLMKIEPLSSGEIDGEVQ
ncbi:MAG: hypothetical protein M0P97_03990 [Candidatus Moranbacteria bacterium]|jgi:hypothetical protein|nr:hypothetical protein [Candidatus Moranbacteria bacterium]